MKNDPLPRNHCKNGFIIAKVTSPMVMIKASKPRRGQREGKRPAGKSPFLRKREGIIFIADGEALNQFMNGYEAINLK